jgi:DNA processing protein
MNIVNRIAPDKHIFLQRTVNIAKPPKCLWYTGKLPENQPTVAIVGSRKPTDYGKYVTLKLASQLAARGVVIISGLALGHDALAHQGALNGGGITVAVLGSGLNNITPRSNAGLAREILQQNGAIISEFEPDMPVLGHQFLERNRIISALADVVIIVEANARSGSLNTAMHALEQGKELMAVPGNITSPLSVGTNKLIFQGAAPVLSVDDVLEKLGMLAVAEQDGELPLVNNETERKIMETIKKGTTDGDEIIKKLKISAADFNQAVTMLEIAGLVRSLGANRWILK